MKYPKPVMRISELIYMGFSYPYLRRAYGTPGQTFATKINPLINFLHLDTADDIFFINEITHT